MEVKGPADPVECPLRSAARRFGQTPALIGTNMTMSYARLDRLVDALAYRFQETGVARGARVATICPRGWEYVVLLWALFRCESVACPISPRFPTQAISAILERIDCRTFIDAGGHSDAISAAGIRRISLSRLFADLAFERGRPTGGGHFQVSGAGGTIVLTSGSFGLPKAVLHRLSSHYFSALGSNRNIAVTPETRWLVSLPLYHVGGLGIVFRTILGGGAMVIPPSGLALGDVLEAVPVTHLSVVATQLHRLLKDPPGREARKRLSAVLVGGGPTGRDLIGEADDRGFPVRTTYGLTEMASQVTTTGPNEDKRALSTSGKVLDYRHVKIQDGEILVKGETLFRGYVSEHGIHLPVDEEGWFRTGDLGEMDEEGYLTLHGRKDNMFISGGENIYAEEVEASIERLSNVEQAVVVPVEDPDFGFRPVAFVRFRNGETVTTEEMIEKLEKELPRFKIPDAFFDWPAASAGGLKPDRKSLSESARKRLGKKE